MPRREKWHMKYERKLKKIKFKDIWKKGLTDIPVNPFFMFCCVCRWRFNSFFVFRTVPDLLDRGGRGQTPSGDRIRYDDISKSEFFKLVYLKVVNI